MSATADDVRWPCDDGVHAVSDDGKCGSCRQPVADDTPAWRSIPGHLAWYWGTKAQGMTILPPRTAGAPPSPGCWRGAQVDADAVIAQALGLSFVPAAGSHRVRVNLRQLRALVALGRSEAVHVVDQLALYVTRHGIPLPNDLCALVAALQADDPTGCVSGEPKTPSDVVRK